MTAFEIISILIGILTLLFTFGSFILTCLSFIIHICDKDKKTKIMPTLLRPGWAPLTER